MVRVWFVNRGQDLKTTCGLERLIAMRRKCAAEVLASSTSGPTARALALKLQSEAAEAAAALGQAAEAAESAAAADAARKAANKIAKEATAVAVGTDNDCQVTNCYLHTSIEHEVRGAMDDVAKTCMPDLTPRPSARGSNMEAKGEDAVRVVAGDAEVRGRGNVSRIRHAKLPNAPVCSNACSLLGSMKAQLRHPAWVVHARCSPRNFQRTVLRSQRWGHVLCPCFILPLHG
jgi:hypothetical protein